MTLLPTDCKSEAIADAGSSTGLGLVFLAAQFALAASALGISHSQGCSHRHWSMGLIPGCCSTSLPQPHDQEMATGSCQHQPHPSLHSRILAEPDPSTGATLNSPVYLRGLVERGVILLFAFPARRRERQSRGKQLGGWEEGKGVLVWTPQGCPRHSVLMLGDAPGQGSHGSKRTLVPITRAFHGSLSHLGLFNISLVENKTCQALQPVPEML